MLNCVNIIIPNKCFNRYMVECEYKLGAGVKEITLVLIDTWWNVNNVTIAGVTKDNKVLIDTWWNVNESSH